MQFGKNNKPFTMRNNTTTLMTPAELAIINAMAEVEKIGTDVILTDAIIYLQEAKNKVSEFVDKQIKEELCK